MADRRARIIRRRCINGRWTEAARIIIKNLTFGFNANNIFNDFSLDLSGANPVFILGPSGCGKTTLLRLMAGLLSPRSGTIDADGKKNAVSFVFQEARLLPYLNILQNVTLPIVKLLGRAEAEKRALFFLRESALSEYASAYPAKLSGGQRQRASIARAWAYPSPVILMDEPFQSLDIPLRIQLMDSVRRLLLAENRFVIAVTHDPREAIYLGKRIIMLGKSSDGSSAITFDESFEDSGADEPANVERNFVSESTILLEKRLVAGLQAASKIPPRNFPCEVSR
ncbi:MAG: ABC transporter ATP-binding protein [Spirochaetaceae bacterium]|jgi:NitT/TauT family transport system ATP-binding protein|nr:ABC transporter ATP-binding protein [Spirochaetaceae bacterium]